MIPARSCAKFLLICDEGWFKLLWSCDAVDKADNLFLSSSKVKVCVESDVSLAYEANDGEDIEVEMSATDATDAPPSGGLLRSYYRRS